jgi:AraC-like DNA-binding protein
MTPLARGRILLWEGGGLWLFEVPPPTRVRKTDFHAHHAIQVTLALDGVFRLEVGGQIVEGPAAVVAADVRHAFEPVGLIGLLFIEPESPEGRAVQTAWLADRPVVAIGERRAKELCDALAAGFRARAADAELAELGRGFAARLAGSLPRPLAPDPRVMELIAWARRETDRPLTLSEAARRTGLSADRTSHLFVEQTGLAFRTYLLWLRMSRAVELYAGGASLTEAAHQAGFSDSAHFSRTFRRMFGVAAAALSLS